jgi:uncharacterized protein YbaR (Trm112 family)
MASDGQAKHNKQDKKQDKPMGIDAATMSLLACPVCRGSLRLENQHENQHLVCAVCARAYPVRNGIPALIADRARP